MDEILTLNSFEQSPLFSAKDRAALAYAQEITANHRYMRRSVKAGLKAVMSDAEIVDLTIACCWHNFMNRFNQCLDIDMDTDLPEELVKLLEATPGPAELATRLP